jgi:hypothetical protein
VEKVEDVTLRRYGGGLRESFVGGVCGYKVRVFDTRFLVG